MKEEMTLSEAVKNAHILVATPNYTNTYAAEVYVNHMECIGKWREWGVDFKWMVVGRTFVHFARSQACEIVTRSQEKDDPFTHILWIDDDALIKPEIIPRFIDHDKDVVIAPYPMRRFPHQIGVLSSTAYICTDCDISFQIDQSQTPQMTWNCPQCAKVSKRDFHNHKAYRNFNSSDMDKGLVQVDGGGTHAMLVKASAFFKKGEETEHHLPEDLVKMRDSLTDEQRDKLDQYVDLE
ncbi:MAG: hypothetical protein KKD01_20280, partial [Proteobacteria bacterium]|nr:hypothetical protein [Pseudomonadota bacterium]